MRASIDLQFPTREDAAAITAGARVVADVISSMQRASERYEVETARRWIDAQPYEGTVRSRLWTGGPQEPAYCPLFRGLEPVDSQSPAPLLTIAPLVVAYMVNREVMA